MTFRKRDIGNVYAVRFLDHSEGDRPAMIEAIGRLRRCCRKYIVLRAWHTEGDCVAVSSQQEWAILRSTIKSVARLRK